MAGRPPSPFIGYGGGTCYKREREQSFQDRVIRCLLGTGPAGPVDDDGDSFHIIILIATGTTWASSIGVVPHPVQADGMGNRHLQCKPYRG